MVEQRTSLWTLLLNLSSKEDLCLIERHFFFLKCVSDAIMTSFLCLCICISPHIITLTFLQKKRLLFFLCSVQPHCSSPLFGLQPPPMQGQRIKNETNIKTMNQANITYKTINTQVATQLLLLLATRYLPSRVEVQASQDLSMNPTSNPNTQT